MKLRIRGDSLRLRLTRSEVRQLRASGRVEQTVHFGPQRALSYVLQRREVEAPRASFEGDRIEVALPPGIADTWADSDQVGIEASQALPEGQLRLLIEKDFQCLAPRAGEDDGDAFPHPAAESGASC